MTCLFQSRLLMNQVFMFNKTYSEKNYGKVLQIHCRGGHNDIGKKVNFSLSLLRLRLAGGGRPYVLIHSFVNQTCEQDILNMYEPMLMQISTSWPQGRAWNNELLGSGGQRSRLHQAEDKTSRHGRGIFLHPFGPTSFSVSPSDKSW